MFIFYFTAICSINVIFYEKTLAIQDSSDLSNESYNALQKLLRARTGSMPVDIVFVIDASRNIGQDYFKCGLEALKDVTKVIDSQNPISIDGTNIGIARSARKFDMELDLHSGNSLGKILNSLDSVMYAGGRNRLFTGLKLAKRMLESRGRRGSYKIVVILTDGKAHSALMVTTVAMLKRMGVEIYAVPVTSTVDMVEIRSIVTQPYNEHIIEAVNYCTLDQAIVKLLPKKSKNL